MKGLVDYINEAFSEARKTLIDYLNDENNSIRDKDLIRALNVVTNMKEEIFDSLKEDTFKGNIKAFKALMNEIEHAHLKAEFIALLDNKDKFPNLEDLKKHNNIYDLFNKDTIELSKEQKDLIDIILKISTKDEKAKGIGKGEIFFNTFIKGAGKGSNGDINIDNEIFEIKGSNSSNKDNTGYKNGGRIRGNNDEIKSPKEIINFLIKEFDNENITDILEKNYISGPNNITKICKLISDLNIADDVIFNTFARGYYYQLFGDPDKMDENVKEYINSLTYTLDNIGNVLIEQIHAILALIKYQMVEHWDNILPINVDNGKYYILSKKNVSFENIVQLANECNEYLHFQDGPSNTKGANTQNYVSSIYVK